MKLIKIFLIILFYLFFGSTLFGQDQSFYYFKAIEWIRKSPEIKREIKEHLKINPPTTNGLLVFAVSDTLMPIEPYDYDDHFDTTDCLQITNKDVMGKLFNSKEDTILDSGRIDFYKPLMKLWNENDLLLVTFGHIFHRQLRADIYLRFFPTQLENNKIVTNKSGIYSSWHPRGRAYNWMAGCIGVSMCFDTTGNICNVRLFKIEN